MCDDDLDARKWNYDGVVQSWDGGERKSGFVDLGLWSEEE
jgi:hypothetical protein